VASMKWKVVSESLKEGRWWWVSTIRWTHDRPDCEQ